MTNDAGTNWTLIEDVTLCTSWVQVTHDPISANEMQLREMWGLIHTNYLEKLVGKEPKNLCPVVGDYSANRLVHGETPWHKLLVIFEVGKIH